MTWKATLFFFHCSNATCSRFSSSPAKRGRSNGALHRTREKVHQGRGWKWIYRDFIRKANEKLLVILMPHPCFVAEVVIMATTWAELHVWLLMGCQNVTCEVMFWCLMFWWNSVVQKHLSFVKLWECDSFEAILQRHSCRKSSKRRAHFIVSFGPL